MGKITLSKLDDATLAEVQRRADRHGRTLEDELCSIVTQAVRPRREDVLRQVDELRERIAHRTGTTGNAVEILQEIRGA